jgi:hypothetical protein
MTDKKWVQRGGGTFFKWDTPGQSLEGLWQGQREGKFGQLGTISTASGNVTFPLHTALEMLLDGMPDGTLVRIVFTGKQMNARSGREFKAFDVFTMDEGDAPEINNENIPF